MRRNLHNRWLGRRTDFYIFLGVAGVGAVLGIVAVTLLFLTRRSTEGNGAAEGREG